MMAAQLGSLQERSLAARRQVGYTPEPPTRFSSSTSSVAHRISAHHIRLALCPARVWQHNGASTWQHLLYPISPSQHLEVHSPFQPVKGQLSHLKEIRSELVTSRRTMRGAPPLTHTGTLTTDTATLCITPLACVSQCPKGRVQCYSHARQGQRASILSGRERHQRRFNLLQACTGQASASVSRTGQTTSLPPAAGGPLTSEKMSCMIPTQHAPGRRSLSAMQIGSGMFQLAKSARRQMLQRLKLRTAPLKNCPTFAVASLVQHLASVQTVKRQCQRGGLIKWSSRVLTMA